MHEQILVTAWLLSEITALLFAMSALDYSVLSGFSLTGGELQFLAVVGGLSALVSLSDKVTWIYE